MLQKSLLEARLRQDLTRDQLAAGLKISTGTLRNWERGRTQPSRRLWKAVAQLTRTYESVLPLTGVLPPA